MAHVVQIAQFGGPEQMHLVPVQVGEPGPGEVRIRQHACGLNYIDVYYRTGLYSAPLPLGLGMEAAGVVEAVGAGVMHLGVGDRAAYASPPTGAYADVRVLPARCVVRLPDGIDYETAAAMMLKGLTVQYLLRRTQPQGGFQPGDAILFHAAAGGVGLIACQWARAMGLTLIGTAGSAAKCELARQHGAAHTIDYSREDVVARVRELTGGKGVRAVYDAVGKDTWERSLDCLEPLGLMVSFGNASGKVPPVDLFTLAAKGSLHVTRPTLFTHLATRESTQAMADDLFHMVSTGQVQIRIDQRYPLADVVRAHEDLQARRTTGSSILIP